MSLCKQTKRVEAKLEAAKVSWGYGQCRSVQFVDDSTGSLTDEYFDLNVTQTDGSVKQYYVLMEGTTTATDPAPIGKEKILVSYIDDDTAADLAAIYVSALASVAVFAVDNGDGSVDVENHYPSEVPVEVFINAPSLTGAIGRVGFGGDLGSTSGGIELNFESQTVEINANQFGAILLDDVMTGNSIELSMELLEMTDDRWKQTVGSTSGETLEVSGGTDLVGFGESKLFQNLNDFAGRLILHPIRLADDDRSADVVIWRSAPLPETITFDGESPQTMSVTFKGYLDSNVNKKINLVSRGDWTQKEVLA